MMRWWIQSKSRQSTPSFQGLILQVKKLLYPSLINLRRDKTRKKILIKKALSLPVLRMTKRNAVEEEGTITELYVQEIILAPDVTRTVMRIDVQVLVKQDR